MKWTFQVENSLIKVDFKTRQPGLGKPLSLFTQVFTQLFANLFVLFYWVRFLVGKFPLGSQFLILGAFSFTVNKMCTIRPFFSSMRRFHSVSQLSWSQCQNRLILRLIVWLVVKCVQMGSFGVIQQLNQPCLIVVLALPTLHLSLFGEGHFLGFWLWLVLLNRVVFEDFRC